VEIAPVVELTPAETATPVETEIVPEVAASEIPTEVTVEGATEAPVGEIAGETAEVTFEELFKLRPESFKPGTEEDDKSDKKGKKGKKSVEYQFDEDRGEVVGRKKHKRGDAEWTGEDW
jgi:N utilization substance protein A